MDQPPPIPLVAESSATTTDITSILDACESGESGAFERLIDAVYPDLKRAAHAQLRRRPGSPLQTTALVHELYLRLQVRGGDGWRNGNHFFAACSKAMRNILIDQARKRLAIKHGGGLERVPLFESEVAELQTDALTLLQLNDLLVRLGSHDARAASVFECRYFGGYSVAETCEALQISKRTAIRDWQRACAWLRVLLREADPALANPIG